MKKFTSKNKNNIDFQDSEFSEFVTFNKIVAPKKMSEESISKTILNTLFTKIDLEDVLTLKIFSRN